MGTPSDPSDDEIYATVPGFGEFVLASDSEPLPVELSGFEATLDGEDAVRLMWTTATETGNAGFRVQRKAEGAGGGSWTTVGSVEGEGTTTKPTSYRYVDENLPYEAGQLTYRHKQVDTDGSAGYSKEVTVDREVTEVQLLGTYPKPGAAAGHAPLRRAAAAGRQDSSLRHPGTTHPDRGERRAERTPRAAVGRVTAGQRCLLPAARRWRKNTNTEADDCSVDVLRHACYHGSPVLGGV